MTQGLVQIYTGDGKGKTTAALGLAVRALGRGWPVRIIQFLKGVRAGEHAAFERLGVPISFVPSDVPPWEARREDLVASCANQLAQAREALAQMDRGLVVLDEIIGALNKEYVTRSDVEALLAARPESVELVLTGRNAPDWLIDRAGLVTRMTLVRHPFSQGVPAREGIEF